MNITTSTIIKITTTAAATATMIMLVLESPPDDVLGLVAGLVLFVVVTGGALVVGKEQPVRKDVGWYFLYFVRMFFLKVYVLICHSKTKYYYFRQ